MDTLTYSPTTNIFAQSEQQQMIVDMIQRYAESEILPHVMEWDEQQILPTEVLKELGAMGLMGVLVPETYGGSGLSYREYITVISEISAYCGAIGLSVAAHNSLCTGHILKFGTEAQKHKYLPALASGEALGAWGLTEANTGSDAGNMQTTAVRDGNEWVLNGTKNFITHGKSADTLVIIARTGEPRTKNNATAFIVERGFAGLKAGKKENKLGMRASETAEVILDEVRVPAENLIGEVGQGFKQALAILDGGRISIAALGLGIAKGAYKAALKYALEREQFGQAIFEFQSLQFKLSEMATRIEAGELLTLKAGMLKDQHLPMGSTAAMAKLFTSEAAVWIANEAVQIFGGYGYIKDFPVEKYYRDAKLCTIGEGTSEIQKLVIARQLKKEVAT